MSYRERLLAHLVEYKHSTLGIHQPGVFNYRGKDVLRDHILPIEHADLNLLPLARELEPSFMSRNLHVSRHRNFHHLNSSQAFAFNLFLPFFDQSEDGATVLLRAFGQTGSLTDWELEAVLRVDEGTNIDALWVTDDGTSTICEVKLSESEFGRASDDDRHRSKLETVYKPVLINHVDKQLLQARAFFEVYQVLRNVWNLVQLDKGRLVFLLPRENEVLWGILTQVLERVVLDTRRRIMIVAIEDVVKKVTTDENCPEKWRDYAGQLMAKYIPTR